MNVSLISFGKKIPVSECNVKDLRTRKFVPVKMYEYDCLDQSDIDEVKSLPDTFDYKNAISTEMRTKKNAKEKYFLDTGVSHYVMQTKEGETLGIASLQKDDESWGVKFLQTSQHSTHKYIGQTMLATIAKMALTDCKKRFEIFFPTDSAMGFYTKKCGFKPEDGAYHLQMFPKDMKKLIFKTQLKTRAQIVDARD